MYQWPRRNLSLALSQDKVKTRRGDRKSLHANVFLRSNSKLLLALGLGLAALPWCDYEAKRCWSQAVTCSIAFLDLSRTACIPKKPSTRCVPAEKILPFARMTTRRIRKKFSGASQVSTFSVRSPLRGPSFAPLQRRL